MKLYRGVAVWDAERKKAELCDLRVENGIIAAVEPAGTFEYGAAFEGRGRTALLPGFVNAHGHPSMTLLRGLGEELPLMDWLTKKIFPVEEKMDAAAIKTGAQLAMLEMLATGTTCFADMYFFEESVAEAALEFGMRAGLTRGIVDFRNGVGEIKLSEGLELASRYNGAQGLINIQLGPHASYTLNLDMTKKIAAAALEYDLGAQLHWLETSQDWPKTAESASMTPEEYLEESGLLKLKQLTLAHCVMMEKEKMPFYARGNITVVHNPKSNLKLGSGIAPVEAMRRAGISVALGTDGACSNNMLDMWDELRFAALLQKGISQDPTLISAEYALEMATVAGAKALGFATTGLIKPGYTADFALVDLDKAHYTGWTPENLAGYLVYSGSSADIVETVVAGRTLYSRGEFPGTDAAALRAKAAQTRKELISAL